MRRWRTLRLHSALEGSVPGSRPCDFNAVINLGAGKMTRDQLPRFLPILPGDPFLFAPSQALL
jgi:hypothetical protein